MTSSESSFFRIPGFELAAEEVREFAFELVIPEGPISFVGLLVGVRWEVRAELIIDWAKNPKGACEFTVVAPAGREALASGYRGPLKRADERDSDLIVSNAITSPLRYSLLLIPPGAGGYVLWVTDFFTPVVVLVVMVTLASFALSWRSLRNRIAQAAMGPVTITLSPSKAYRGQAVVVSVELRPTRRLELQSAKFTVVCTESATVKKGNDTSSERVANVVLPVPLGSSLQLEAGESRRLTGTATLPENCLPSFGAKRNNSTVEWEVFVALERNGADYRQQLPLQVLP